MLSTLPAQLRSLAAVDEIERIIETMSKYGTSPLRRGFCWGYDMFLTDEELAELTGIKKGHNGKTREELQCEHLRRIGIPFYPNARGRPVVVAATLTERQAEKPRPRWQPKVLHMR